MLQVHVRTPAEASEQEQAAFLRMVPEGGAMTEAAVRAGLPLAEALVISENTVKRHLKAIFVKLEVNNRAAAVARLLGQ